MENRNGKVWTDEEIKRLNNLFESGLSDEEIGERLGRTRKSIKMKRNMIGLVKCERNGSSSCTWTNKEKQLLIDNYSSMTVSQLAKLIGKTEGSIRGMKTKLGLHKRNHYRTDAELDIIREYYEEHIDEIIDLKMLSEMLGRTPQIISRWANEMGLTNRKRTKEEFKNIETLIGKNKYRRTGEHKEEYKKAAREAFNNMDKNAENIRSEFQKELWKTEFYQNYVRPKFVERMIEYLQTHEHPRGMLGKHHTIEVGELISKLTKERYANMSQEEKHAIAMKGLETKKKNGTLVGTTSNAYSRTKGGKRQDLNNHYFRSAWEANIARILNHLGIKWEYESKRFYFKESIDGVASYQPDFYLPELDKWIEVKGWMDEKSKTRLRLFEEQYPEEYAKLLLIDEQKYYEYENDYNFLPYWEGKGKYYNKGGDANELDTV